MSSKQWYESFDNLLPVADIIKGELADPESPAHCGHDGEVFYLGWRHGLAVIFETFTCGGMVGETVKSTEAFLMNAAWSRREDGKDRRIQSLTYEGVKALYAHIEGRTQRIRYWRHMWAMSPEGIAAQEQASYHEAMAIVR